MGEEWKNSYCILGLQGSAGHLLAFSWVCAAGLSDSLPHYSEIVDPILVTLGKM